MLIMSLFTVCVLLCLQKALSDSKHSVTYMSSSIRQTSSDVHEVLILLQLYSGQYVCKHAYHSIVTRYAMVPAGGKVIDLMNSKLSSGQRFSEQEVLKIFTDTCQAVARLHHRTKPITHRDLKVSQLLAVGQGLSVMRGVRVGFLKPLIRFHILLPGVCCCHAGREHSARL